MQNGVGGSKGINKKIKMTEESFVATTLFGLEEVLAGELHELGAGNISVFHRAVRFSGGQALL